MSSVRREEQWKLTGISIYEGNYNLTSQLKVATVYILRPFITRDGRKRK